MDVERRPPRDVLGDERVRFLTRDPLRAGPRGHRRAAPWDRGSGRRPGAGARVRARHVVAPGDGGADGAHRRGHGEPHGYTGRGVRVFFWSYTSGHILYLQDTHGDENWRVYAINLTTGETKDLTPFEGVQAQIQGGSPKFPHELLIGLNNRDPQFHDLHRVNLQTGEMTLVIDGQTRVVLARVELDVPPVSRSPDIVASTPSASRASPCSVTSAGRPTRRPSGCPGSPGARCRWAPHRPSSTTSSPTSTSARRSGSRSATGRRWPSWSPTSASSCRACGW